MIRWGTIDFGEEEREAIYGLINVKNPSLTMGAKTYEFERKFAKWLGRKYGVLVNSGTSALIIALKSSLYEEEPIFVSPLTYPAVWNSIKNTNNRVVCQDISNFVSTTQRKWFNLAVHFLGKPCKKLDLDDIETYIIEDASEAIGSKYKNRLLGSYGILSCFSFYVAHQINTIEGGMVVTNNKDLYEKCLSLRDNGRLCSCPVCTLKTVGKCKKRLEGNKERRWITTMAGYNFKPTEIQAVLGLVKLRKINKIIERRHQILDRYNEAFGEFIEEKDEYIVPLAYPVEVKNPQYAIQKLEKEGIECRGMFPSYSTRFKEATRISNTYIMIPSHQNLMDEEVEYIIEEVGSMR